MGCEACGGYAENIGTVDAPVLVHRAVGACWEGGGHAYRPQGRQPEVEAVDRTFKVRVQLAPGVFKLYWPWEVPR